MRFAERLGPLLLQTDTQEMAGSATVCCIPEERRNNLATLFSEEHQINAKIKIAFRVRQATTLSREDKAGKLDCSSLHAELNDASSNVTKDAVVSDVPRRQDQPNGNTQGT